MVPFLTVRVAFDSDPLSTPTWTDITRQAEAIGVTTGRQQETDDFQAGTLSLTLANQDRRFDPLHAAGPYFGKLKPRKRIQVGCGSYLNLPGVDLARATCPDTAALDITGDLDLRACIRMNDWTPPADFGLAAVIGKWEALGTYGLIVTSTGFLALYWYDSGGTQRSANSTVATGFVDGTDHWIRATLDVDNGAAGRDIKFYTSNDPILTDPSLVTWTQLGTTVTQAGTTSIRATTDTGFIGALGSFEEWVGRFYRGQIRNGINGQIVASPDFTFTSQGTYTDTQGNVWSLQGTASLAGDPDLYPIYEGFVDGWPQTTFRPPESAETTITATDLFGLLANIELPRSVYAIDGALADDPVLYYPLGEQSGDLAIDIAQGQHAAYNVDPSTLSGNAGVFGGSPTMRIPEKIFAGPSPVARTDALGMPTAFPASMEAWIRPEVIPDGTELVSVDAFYFQVVGLINMSIRAKSYDIALNAQDDWTISCRRRDGTDHDDWQSDVGYTLHDRIHHIVIASGATPADIAVYLDGAAIAVTNSPGNPTAPTATWLTIGGWSPTSDTTETPAHITECAIYDFELSAAQVLAHYNAGVNAWSGDKTGARVDRILDLCSIGANDRNIDTGIVTLRPTALATDALSYLKSIEATEDGQLYVAPDGMLRFRDRNELATDTARRFPQAMFSDRPDYTAAVWDTSTWDTNAVWGGPPVIRYQPDGLRFELSEQFIYNDVSVSWDVGTETWDDATSITTYGRRALSISTRLATSGEAKLRAIELVDRYKEPRIQVSGITVDMAGTKNITEQDAALGLRIGDRVTVRFHPQSVGSALEIDAYIEGISDQIDNGINQWKRSFNLSLAI